MEIQLPSRDGITSRRISRRKRRRKRLFFVIKLIQAIQREHRVLHIRECRAIESFRRGVIRAAARANYLERCQSFIDFEWKTIFRMSRRSMEALRNILAPHLETNLHPNNIKARADGNRRPLTIDEKLMIGLQFLGGVPLGGLLHGFHTCKTAIYDAIGSFVKSVILTKVGVIKFPETAEEMMEKAQLFTTAKHYISALYGCIGALDGLAVRIGFPSKKEVPNQIAFVNRKGFPSFNVQGIADADARCIYLSVVSPGSTHDSTAWELSSLCHKWKDNTMHCPMMGRRFYLAMDEAYAATDNQCCPWPGQALGATYPYRDAFNFFLSGAMRNVVERMFGQVYKRWGLLWRPIHLAVRKVPVVVQCIFQLHNFLKDMQEPDMNIPGLGGQTPGEPNRTRTRPSGFDNGLNFQNDCALEVRQHNRRVVSSVRQAITEELERENIVRPEYGDRLQV